MKDYLHRSLVWAANKLSPEDTQIIHLRQEIIDAAEKAYVEIKADVPTASRSSVVDRATKSVLRSGASDWEASMAVHLAEWKHR